jgi:N-acetylmuramoyl-L-alanine amidase
MDRKTRRLRRIRIRSRRTKLIAGAALVAASVVVLAAAAFGQQGRSVDRPTPKVDKVDLSPDPAPVEPGWEGQVGTDANLVAVQWNGDTSAQYTFEFRNADGKWLKAADSGTFDNGPDPGSKDANAGGATPQTKNVTEPVWIGRDVTGVRVRLDSGSAQDVTLHVIDSTTGKKPDTNVESTSPTPTTAPAPPPPPSAPAPSAGGGLGASPSSTTTTQPLEGFGLGQGLAAAAIASLVVAFIVRRRRLLAVLVVVVVAVGVACAPTKDGPGSPTTIPGGIVPRSQWGPDLPWSCPGGPEYTYVANAIVHHTVNSNNYGPGDSVGLLRGIWAYHVQTLGYCDIAYNFLIDNYGVPFEGRLGGIDQPVLGAHSLNWNTGTTGIAMLGTFSSVTPSDTALTTLQDLIRWKFKVHGVNPFDVDYAHILGHRDTYATECPGNALYNYLPYTRHYVKLYW